METSTISALERVKAKAEEKISQLILSKILDSLVENHCRKGQRKCDCSYCSTKKQWTWAVGFCSHSERELLRLKARQALQKEKERI